MLQLLLAVFIGGGTGSVARWLLSMRFNPLHQAIPLGTLAANLIGAFIIGMGFAWFSRMTNIDPVWKVLITTGFLWRSNNLLNIFGRSGVFVTRGPLWLGVTERFRQPSGVFCHDRTGFLAVFRLNRTLKTKKTR